MDKGGAAAALTGTLHRASVARGWTEAWQGPVNASPRFGEGPPAPIEGWQDETLAVGNV